MRTIETVAAPGRRRLTVTWFVAAPGLLFVLLTVGLVVGPAVGWDPIWYSEPLSLPEAAGLRDNAEIVRLIQHGADPNAPGVVRAGFVKSNAITLTPLEAAVGIRREDTVALLLDEGATMDAATWTRLTCFARQERAGDVVRLLESRRPADADAAADCAGVKTPW